MRPSMLRRGPPAILCQHSTTPARLVRPGLFTAPTSTQTRTLFDALLSSTLGPAPLRHLTHTQTLPYPPALLFKTVSSIDAYSSFLPFTLSSVVTTRDAHGYPSRATLKVGYDKFGLEEDWDSVVRCDEARGVVEASSAAGPRSEEGLFEVLKTRWEIGPAREGAAEHGSLARLDLHMQFRNPVYDQMFAQVESKVARAVIAAFEKRVGELAEPKR